MRVLFVTPYIEKDGWYDYFQQNSHHGSRIFFHLKLSYGLRFLKQNVPGIEVLEYPTWEEFEAALARGWDVVGLSFHTSGTNRVARMAERARRAGVSQIWGGNYGAMNPALSGLFDRVFCGYAEEEVARALGTSAGPIRHPLLVEQWYIKPFPFRVQRVGVLHTQRGCAMKCTFCQSPGFAPRPEPVPLESLDEVMGEYRKAGVDWLFIIDENFGQLAGHTEKVVELLRKHRLFWSVQSRYENAVAHLDHWCRSYLMGVGIGIESVDPQALKSWRKKLAPASVLDLKERLHERGRYLWGYFMIGSDRADYQATLDEIETVASYGIGYIQTTVLTPYPATALWDEIREKYGIFERDWERFDTKHLTWNHPHISPDQMEKLLSYACERFNGPAQFWGWIWRIYRSYSLHLGSYGKGLFFISGFPVKSYLHPTVPPLPSP
ncbi:MAG: radical SAM protein [Thermodesulfobacteriota bacterium]